MKYLALLLFSGAVFAVSPASAMRLRGGIAHATVNSCGRNAICGLTNPEDVVRLGSTQFAIASSLARAPHSPSHLYLVDFASKVAAPIVPSKSPYTKRSLDPTCAPPENFRTLITHGLASRSDGPGHGRLYVVNHGGKQSIELFEWRVHGRNVALTWRGCVHVPSTVLANAVAPLPDGVAVTSFGSPNDPKLANLVAGRPSGFVMIWSERTGWIRLQGSDLPGDNGIESSPDGRTLYVNAWTDNALWILSRDGRRMPRRVALGEFHPDNIHWQPDGTLLIAGEVGDPSRILSCGPRKICSTPSMLVVFDPVQGSIAARDFFQPTIHFGAASTAIKYHGRYWLSSFLGDRMFEAPVAPAGSSAATGRDGSMGLDKTPGAESVYKCSLPNGTYQYSDVACSDPRASIVHVNTKLDAGTRQAGGNPLSIPAKFRNGQSTAPLKPWLPNDLHVRTRALLAQNIQPSAYECLAGPKHWIQTVPCPQVYLKDPRDTTDDPSLNGEPERGSSVLLERVPVHQQPLDKSELCRKLDDESISVKHNGSSDVYERNLTRSKYCP
jgi:hypothetical protein